MKDILPLRDPHSLGTAAPPHVAAATVIFQPPQRRRREPEPVIPESEMNNEQAIRDLVTLWLSASEKGDVSTLLGLLADDVTFMVPGKEPFGKDAFAKSIEAMNGTRVQARSDIQELIVLGDWAWMRNHLNVTITSPEGQTVLRAGYVLTILRKNSSGNWVIARDANLLMPVAG